MSEYRGSSEYGHLDNQRTIPTEAPYRSGAAASQPSQRPDLITIIAIVLPALALAWTSFLPWISLRLPGLEHRQLSLNELSGGRFIVALSVVLIGSGVPLLFVRIRLAAVIVALGVALLGWLAGLAVIAVGIVRGLIPAIAIARVDVADGLIGQGPGVVLAIGAAVILATEITQLLATKETTLRQSNVAGLSILVLIFGLAASHHSQWVLVTSQSVNSRLAVSGDSLFGSVVVAILTWVAAAFAAGNMAGIRAARLRVLAVILIVLAALKILQLIVVWAGTSFLDWTLPDSVGRIAAVDLRAGFYVTAVFTLLVLVSGVVALSQPQLLDRHVSTRPLRIVPGAALLLGTVLMSVVFQPTENRDDRSGTSRSSSGGTNSAFTLSTAYVVVVDASDSPCARGSGAFIGDGTFIITNEHVISTDDLPSGCDQVVVRFGADPASEPDSWFSTRVLWSNESDDLAILQVDGLTPGETRPLQIEYSRLDLGAEIRVFGYPSIGGETLTLTTGIVSGFERAAQDYYKVSAALNAGNSGGPVVDEKGRLVGVAAAVARSEVSCESAQQCFTDGTNVGLVIPIDLAQLAINEYVS